MTINRPTIPILGILLAVSGLVLGGFTWVTVSRLEAQVANFPDQDSCCNNTTIIYNNITIISSESWYRYNGTSFNTNPIYTYLTLTGLTVEFELEQNESVYFSFSSSAHLEPNPTSWSRIYVYFRVDGIFQSEPSAEVGMYQETVTHHFMLHLQAVREDLSAGLHNVTVVIYGDSTGNYIWKSSLFVQKFST